MSLPIRPDLSTLKKSKTENNINKKIEIDKPRNVGKNEYIAKAIIMTNTPRKLTIKYQS